MRALYSMSTDITIIIPKRAILDQMQGDLECTVSKKANRTKFQHTWLHIYSNSHISSEQSSCFGEFRITTRVTDHKVQGYRGLIKYR